MPIIAHCAVPNERVCATDFFDAALYPLRSVRRCQMVGPPTSAHTVKGVVSSEWHIIMALLLRNATGSSRACGKLVLQLFPSHVYRA